MGDGSRVQPRPDTRSLPHLLRRALLWGAVYYGASQIGLLTTVADQPLTLVSPSVGVAVVWFATGDRRTWPWDAAALALAGVASSLQIGVPWGLVVTAPLISLVQVAVFVAVLRRGSPDLVPFGGRWRWRLVDLGVLVTAGAAGALCGATLTTVTQAVAGLPTGDLEAFFLRWGVRPRRSRRSVPSVSWWSRR